MQQLLQAWPFCLTADCICCYTAFCVQATMCQTQQQLAPTTPLVGLQPQAMRGGTAFSMQQQQSWAPAWT